MKLTGTQKLLNILVSAEGRNVPTANLSKRTGLTNVRAAVSRLRMEGFDIYNNSRKTRNGVATYYRLAI